MQITRCKKEKDEFLDRLDQRPRAKVAALISLLEEEGPNLKRPFADIVKGKIRELRIHHSSNQYRILYFFGASGIFMGLHKIWWLRVLYGNG